jgi:hypothetical protein
MSYAYFPFHFFRFTRGRLAMSFPYTPNVLDEKVESLQTQSEYLRILRLRHLQWMSAAEDAGLQSIHRELAEQIEQLTDSYHHLLHVLEKRGDLGD